jgi:hypothetical protein
MWDVVALLYFLILLIIFAGMAGMWRIKLVLTRFRFFVASFYRQFETAQGIRSGIITAPNFSS